MTPHRRQNAQNPRNRAASALLTFLLAVSIVAVHPLPPVAADVGFADLDEAPAHRGAIEEIQRLGITDGTACEPGKFCPNQPLERWVMAVWLVRALDGSGSRPSSNRFTDVNYDLWWAPFVDRLAVLGVTIGCDTQPARYCPDQPVTRGQMATFLTRAVDLDPAQGFGFTDVSGNVHESSINALAGAGITIGCDTQPARFCPDQPVTRGQMATFLTRALDDTATGGKADPLGVVLNSVGTRAVNGAFGVEVSFARPVSDFDAGDISVVNGRATSVTGSGSDYQVTVLPSAEGAVVVHIPGGAAHDGDGNPNQASERLGRIFTFTGRSAGPGLDTWDRAAVVASFRAEFEREEPDSGLGAVTGRCDSRMTSQAYRNSVVQRVNWYRDMVGLHPVTERADLSSAAQKAAVIMSAQGELSHFPGSSWACYTSEGDASAASSNLGLGTAGVEGIDSYIIEHGENNIPVGHRRWILYPQLTEVGTGNVTSPRGLANALDVLGGSFRQSEVREPRGFVAWPPSGFVPVESAVATRWSFSLEGADFGRSTVSVHDDHGPVEAPIIYRGGGTGDPALVWDMYDSGGSLRFSRFNFPAGDYCYEVTITDVAVGGVKQVPYEYTVCLVSFDAEHFRQAVDLKWSPDGTKFIYTSGYSAWTINTDGTGQRPLRIIHFGQWSPDGTRITYTDWVGPDWAPSIWIMDADGTNRQRITNGEGPVWSPDGTRIAYTHVDDLPASIWIMDADGTNRQQITNGEGPVWSPDGTKIAYEADVGLLTWGIWTVDVDGANRQRVTTVSSYSPAWSPDGTKIAYTTSTDGIWIVDVDGTNQKQLTSEGNGPDWSPDGTRIVYHTAEGEWWVVNLSDGSRNRVFASDR